MENELRIRLNQAREKLKEIDEKLMDSNIMSDILVFKNLSKEKANLDPIIETFDKFEKLESDLEDAKLMLNDSDEEIVKFAKESIINLNEQLQKLEEDLKVLLIPKDPNDDKNIVVEIRGAVGGDEANIFAGDLFRMYVKYAEKKGWKLQMIEESYGSVGGYSLVSFMIKGHGVYSRLKFESGAHRVQRVPKTEANGRIHTSTATLLIYMLTHIDLKVQVVKMLIKQNLLLELLTFQQVLLFLVKQKRVKFKIEKFVCKC